MYSNNILNSHGSTTILNACTKKSGNLLNAPLIYMYIYIFTSGLLHRDFNQLRISTVVRAEDSKGSL